MKENPTALCYRHIHLDFLFNLINKIGFRHPRILDLGCGPCFDLQILARHFEKVNITGVDLARPFIERCRYSLPQGDFLNIDIFDFLQTTSGSWDIIISNFGVINFFPPSKINLFFELINTKLSDKGILFISFLNKIALNEIMHFILTLNFKKVLRRFQTNHKGFNEKELRVYFYTIPYIRSIARRHNLKPYKIKGAGWIVPPPYVKTKRKLINLLCFIEKKFPVSLLAYLSDFSIITFKTYRRR